MTFALQRKDLRIRAQDPAARAWELSASQAKVLVLYLYLVLDAPRIRLLGSPGVPRQAPLSKPFFLSVQKCARTDDCRQPPKLGRAAAARWELGRYLDAFVGSAAFRPSQRRAYRGSFPVQRELRKSLFLDPCRG